MNAVENLWQDTQYFNNGEGAGQGNTLDTTPAYITQGSNRNDPIHVINSSISITQDHLQDQGASYTNTDQLWTHFPIGGNLDEEMNRRHPFYVWEDIYGG